MPNITSPLSHSLNSFLFFVLIGFFLLACDVQQTNQATLEFSIGSSNLEKLKGKPIARSVNDENGTLTSVALQISNSDNQMLVEKIVTLPIPTIQISVPSGTELNINAQVFEDDVLRYKGETSVAPLLPGQSHGVSFFLYDINQEIIQVDIGLSNKPADGISTGASVSISRDYVLFTSAASNLVDSDENDSIDLFLRDLNTNSIINLHSSTDGNLASEKGSLVIDEVAISADGHYVVFTSHASNLVDDDTNNVSDIFLKDTLTGETKRISLIGGVDEASLPSSQPDISLDGRRILFYSEEDLTGDGGRRLFLLDRIDKSLVALIEHAQSPKISGDGKYFVYYNTKEEGIYLFDIENNRDYPILYQTDSLQKISALQKKPVTRSKINPFEYNISGNGRYVAFTSSRSIDNVDKGHVYLFDQEDKSIRRLSESSDSTPLLKGDTEQTNPGLSDDGRYAVFLFNGSVYVKSVSSGGLKAVASGDSPFISLDGRRIGFTSNTGRLLLLDNPLYEVFATVNARPPIEPKRVSASLSEDALKINLDWSKDANSSYYRVYLGADESITPNNYFQQALGAQYESLENELSITNSFGGVNSLFFIVTSVNSAGESSPSQMLEVSLLTKDQLVVEPETNESEAEIANSAPVFVGSSSAEVTMSEDGVPVSFELPTLIAYDVDKDELTWTISQNGSLGVANINVLGSQTEIDGESSNTVNYDPNPNVFGSDSFTISVSDPSGETAHFNVNVILVPVNDAPTFSSQPSLNALGSTIYDYSIRVSDIDSDVSALIIDASRLPSWLTLQKGSNNREANLTGLVPPSADNYPVTLTVSDGGSSPIVEQEFTIVAGESVTIAENSVASISEAVSGQQTTITIQAKDQAGNLRTSGGESNMFSISIGGANAGASVSGIVDMPGSPGIYTANYTPTVAGQDTIMINFTDRSQKTAPIDGSPYTSPIQLGSPNDLGATVNVSDIYLSWTAISGLSYKVYRGTTPGINVSSSTPIAAGVVGGFYNDTSIQKDQIYYYVVTANISTLESSASNEVSSINNNDAPIFVDSTGQDLNGPMAIDVAQNATSARNIDFFANDPDGDSISWSVSTAPTKGSIALDMLGNSDSKILAYTPTVDQSGNDYFILTIDDGSGGSDTIRVDLSISPNTPPVVKIETPVWLPAVLLGESVNYTATASDIEDDAAEVPLTYNWRIWGQNYLVEDINVLNPGEYIFPAAGDYNASLVVTDRHGVSRTASANTVKVRNPPVVDTDNFFFDYTSLGTNDLEAIIGINRTSDGKFIITTIQNPGFDTRYLNFYRINASGVPDITYGENGKVTAKTLTWTLPERIENVVIDSNDNMLVLVNYKTSYGATNFLAGIWKFDSTGVRDNSYGTAGIADFPGGRSYVNKMVIGSNDTVYVTGREEIEVVDTNGVISLNKNLAVWKLDGLTGVADSGFASAGLFVYDGSAQPNTTDEGNSLLLHNQNLYVSGSTVGPGENGTDLLLLRLDTNGVLDDTYGSSGVSIIDSRFDFEGVEVSGNNYNSNLGNGLAIDKNNRLLVATSESVIGESPVKAKVVLWRIDESGIPDSSFGSSGKGFVFYDTYVYDPDIYSGPYRAGVGSHVRINENDEIIMTGTVNITGRKLFGMWFYDDSGQPLTQYGRNGTLLSAAGIKDDIGSASVFEYGIGRTLVFGLNNGYNTTGYIVPFRFQ